MNTHGANDPGFFSRNARLYENQTGQSAIAWILVALANLAMQAVFYHAMVGGPIHEESAGEFGTLNAALGIIGLLTVPLLAVHQAFHLYPSRPLVAGQETHLDSLRVATVTVTETSSWVWGGFCFLLLFLPLPLPTLPRFPLQLFTFMNVLIALGGVISLAVCLSGNRLRLWAILLVGAALTRVFIGAGLTAMEPWADSGLAAILIAGFITLTPALRAREIDMAARLKAFRAVFDRDFLLFAGATFSVLLGIYLFTNADRIVTLGWIDVIPTSDVIMGVDIRKVDFDEYQAAGLLGRTLLWGTQPLLWILFAQRTRINKTDAPSLMFFWIYLGALVLGAVVLGLLTQPGNLEAMGWPFYLLGPDGPTFAAVMVPLGLLQALGIFSLASRRYPECFTLGGCSVAYTIILLLFGRKPELILPYMFGASLISLMAVLFVGVVSWGRKQP